MLKPSLRIKKKSVYGKIWQCSYLLQADNRRATYKKIQGVEQIKKLLVEEKYFKYIKNFFYVFNLALLQQTIIFLLCFIDYFDFWIIGACRIYFDI